MGESIIEEVKQVGGKTSTGGGTGGTGGDTKSKSSTNTGTNAGGTGGTGTGGRTGGKTTGEKEVISTMADVEEEKRLERNRKRHKQ